MFSVRKYPLYLLVCLLPLGKTGAFFSQKIEDYPEVCDKLGKQYDLYHNVDGDVGAFISKKRTYIQQAIFFPFLAKIAFCLGSLMGVFLPFFYRVEQSVLFATFFLNLFGQTFVSFLKYAYVFFDPGALIDVKERTECCYIAQKKGLPKDFCDAIERHFRNLWLTPEKLSEEIQPIRQLLMINRKSKAIPINHSSAAKRIRWNPAHYTSAVVDKVAQIFWLTRLCEQDDKKAVLVLIKGPPGQGKTHLANLICWLCGYEPYDIECDEMVQEKLYGTKAYVSKLSQCISYSHGAAAFIYNDVDREINKTAVARPLFVQEFDPKTSHFHDRYHNVKVKRPKLRIVTANEDLRDAAICDRFWIIINEPSLLTAAGKRAVCSCYFLDLLRKAAKASGHLVPEKMTAQQAAFIEKLVTQNPKASIRFFERAIDCYVYKKAHEPKLRKVG